MATIADIDPYYIKSLTALHSGDHLTCPTPVLQQLLEDAIRVKTGQQKDLTACIQALLQIDDVEEANTLPAKTNASSSDNELEMDLLKEDLMCVVCGGWEIAARNQLLECTDCHCLYHQECHRPAVAQRELFEWVCAKCKRARKSPAPQKPHKTGRHSSSSSKSRSSSSSGGKSSRGPGISNAKIISADKRIRIMKKKAAKLHEKKKSSKRSN